MVVIFIHGKKGQRVVQILCCKKYSIINFLLSSLLGWGKLLSMFAYCSVKMSTAVACQQYLV